ncbi:outer membrane beta-barrel protein [Duganella sp. BuS-21]|uniref:outer membrane beta-barrel protein n=1 Tax=Duganella sp. BuS-21 TaxID=2943848 RepID=UPI0035A61206
MNKFLCSTLIALAASSLAHAEDLYIGAGFSAADKGHIRYTGSGGVEHDSEAKRSGVAAGLFVGYVLSPSWALEAGYRGIGNTQKFDLDPGYQIKVRTGMTYLAARNTWRLSEDWALYGKLGVAQGRLKAGIIGKDAPPDATVKKNGVYLGLGASYMVSKDIALQLELEHTHKLRLEGLNASMDKFSLGVRVGF